MKRLLVGFIMSVGLIGSVLAQEKLFECDFTKSEVGKVPDEFLVLDGAFAVVEEGTNRFLELPGAPLETFGALFGPTEKDGIQVSARIYGTGKGRRFPVLGVGLNGAVPFRLQVTPSKKALELYRGDDLLVSVPFAWESGSWTKFQLRSVKSKEGEWVLSGKAWRDGTEEPKQWIVTSTSKEEPSAGKASIWGKPYSETPIHFDDLLVTRAKP